MPELPEVEVIKRYLSNLLVGKSLSSVNVLNRKLRYEVPQTLENINKAKITHVLREGKYLNFFLDNSLVLIVHLAISGRLLVKNLGYVPEKHDHIVFNFDNMSIVYNDIRKFGLVDLVDQAHLSNHKLLKYLGIEPLSENFNSDVLFSMLQKSKVCIKQFLMNSKLIVGIGNIYANEILFYSQISPYRKCFDISKLETVILERNIKNILKKSIELGGSSIKDFVNPEGIKGKFADNLAVYKRGKLQCISCSKGISSTKIQGRSTFFCSSCQK